MRQADFFFRHLRQMRGEHDTTGMARPVFRRERRVIVWSKRITGVAENAFDEIKVAD